MYIYIYILLNMTYKGFVDFAGVQPPFSAIAIEGATTINSEIRDVLKYNPVSPILPVS